MTYRQRTIVYSVIGAVLAIVAAQIVGNYITRDREALAGFTSEVGRFSVMLPPGVHNESDVLESKMGPLEFVMYKAESKYVQFMIAYTDYPGAYMESTTPAEILKAAAKGAATNINGKLKEEEAFIHKGIATREVRVKGPNGVHMRCRVLLVGDRMYQLMALSRRNHIKDRKIDDVFDSFEVVEAPATPGADDSPQPDTPDTGETELPAA